MKLIDQPWRTLRDAWSARLMWLAVILTGVEAVLPLITPERPDWWWWLLTFAVVAGALVARIVAQPSLHRDSDGK